MSLRLALLLLMMGSVFVPPRAARACGGGVVTTTQAGTIGADVQRILIAVHGGRTDVITQIGVPATTADYGVLIPVPSEPTLDPTPVQSIDMDLLDAKTAPRFINEGPNEGGIPVPDCGCGSDKGVVDQPFDAGVHVSQPVRIGPVTAVALTADTGGAINAWLAGNGFVLPAGDQSLVDAYAGTGRYFIAIRRSDTAATGGATSVGVHFTLAGDERGLPLRFARLGAATTVAFTVFVAAEDGVVAPSSPFAALTINDLSGGSLNSLGYASALSSAVSQRGNHAFVLEGAWPLSSPTLSNAFGLSLSQFLWPSQTLTRLSTILPAAALDTDVVFDQPYSGTVPNQRYTQRTPAPGGKIHLAFGAGLLAFAAVARRPRRR